jgi:hypothetical protein
MIDFVLHEGFFMRERESVAGSCSQLSKIFFFPMEDLPHNKSCEASKKIALGVVGHKY